MKSTEYFKNVIQCYLEHRASCDELFAVLLAKPNKDIDACISLKTMKVVQSYGTCNSNTKYHDQIIQLVNKNANLIRKRLTA